MPEAAAEPADGDERLEELGPGRQQLAELVDDDDQVGQRRQVRPGRGGSWYARIESTLPASRSSCWRRSSSPASEARIRSTRDRSSARLVMSPAVCGSRPQVGERRAALEVDEQHVEQLGRVPGGHARATSDRSSSLLPEPVAPTSTPCGPMPS